MMGLEFCTLPAKTVTGDVTIAKAIETMLQEDVSLLLVADGRGKIIGVLSESTLLAAAFDPPLRADPISLHMERKFVSVKPDHSVEQLVETFLLHRVRYLPILDREGHARGIASRRELLRELIGDGVRKAPVLARQGDRG